MTKPVVLVIGGIDPQGCAGLSQDIQAISHNGGHPIAVTTCLTEQSSQGLTNLGALSAEQFMGQYRSAVADFDIAAIKIGLIPSLSIAECIRQIVDKDDVPVVIDPVFASTSGGTCSDAELIEFIARELLPKASLVTPNLVELAQLTQQKVDGYQSVEVASQYLINKGVKACLSKGGHSDDDWASDYFFDGQNAFYCYQPKLAVSVRATGCVLASVIAYHLAVDLDVRDAIVLAKAYLNRGIRLSQTLSPYRVIYHSSEQMVLEDIPKLCYQANLIGRQFTFPDCPKRLGIYPVVDNSDWIEKLVAEGITTIQLRVKDQTDELIKQQINASVDACDDNIAFFVNDYWQQAVEAGAYGVHLGQEDLHDAQLEKIEQAGLRLGVSTHSYWELARALAINPSYIALGPVYATTSKQMPWIPQGVAKVEKWTELLGDVYPLVAIGGIDLERAKQLKTTKVGSVAMISAITKANDYQHATQALIKTWAE